MPPVADALCRSVDVADAAAIEHFAAEVREQLGPIDLWINNAGVVEPIASVRDSNAADWARSVAVNLLGTVSGSRAFLTNRAANAMLLNIASRAGRRPAAGLAAYSATKAAVIALTEAINDEESERGVRALVVIPPSIDTDMQATLLAQDQAVFPGVRASRARRDAGLILSPEDAAQRILGAVLDRPADGFVVDLTGQE